MLGGGQPKLVSQTSLKMLGSSGQPSGGLNLRTSGPQTPVAGAPAKLMPLGAQPATQPMPMMPKVPAPTPSGPPHTLATPPQRPMQKSQSNETVEAAFPAMSASPPLSVTPPPSQPSFPSMSYENEPSQPSEPQAAPVQPMSPPPFNPALSSAPMPSSLPPKLPPPKLPAPGVGPGQTAPKLPVAPVPVVGKAPPKLPSAAPPKQPAPQQPAATAPAPGPPKTTSLAMLGPAPSANPKLQSRQSILMPMPVVQGKMLPLAPKQGSQGELSMLPSGLPQDDSLSALLADAQSLGLLAAEPNPEPPGEGSGSPRPFGAEGSSSPTRSLSPSRGGPSGGLVSPVRGLSPGRERPGESDGAESEIDLKRRQIVTEILESERKYKNYLQVLVDVRRCHRFLPGSRFSDGWFVPPFPPHSSSASIRSRRRN